MAILKNTIIDDTGHLQFPAGTTEQRSSDVTARTRFNTTTNQLEFYDGVAWNPIWKLSGYITSATGGTISFANTANEVYRIHTFTTSGTFTINTIIGVPNVEYLIVGGGGGGGSDAGGGGGGGGVVHGFTEALTVGTYVITVGAGGPGAVYNPGQGGNSQIAQDQATLYRGIRSFGNDTGSDDGAETAFGGGGGCNGTNMHGTSGLFDAHQSDKGGSGGGAGPQQGFVDFSFTSHLPGTETTRQGTSGGGSMNYLPLTDNTFKGGGGGGGAQRPGVPAPNGNSPVLNGGQGGDGYPWLGLFSNNSVTYYGGGGAGGGGLFGGGGASQTNSLGGGAKGGFYSGASRIPAENGVSNTGGGGGGANVSTGSTPGTDRFAGGAGGSGVVIIKYRVS